MTTTTANHVTNHLQWEAKEPGARHAHRRPHAEMGSSRPSLKSSPGTTSSSPTTGGDDTQRRRERLVGNDRDGAGDDAAAMFSLVGQEWRTL